ncbi:hypothetical protein [Paraburkholderia bannensis]|uniref:hypothetical protein n=1 Tax=Paraburkholderia bannensis TaxID=765414 RepID=UPI001427B7E9
MQHRQANRPATRRERSGRSEAHGPFRQTALHPVEDDIGVRARFAATVERHLDRAHAQQHLSRRDRVLALEQLAHAIGRFLCVVHNDEAALRIDQHLAHRRTQGGQFGLDNVHLVEVTLATGRRLSGEGARISVGAAGRASRLVARRRVGALRHRRVDRDLAGNRCDLVRARDEATDVDGRTVEFPVKAQVFRDVVHVLADAAHFARLLVHRLLIRNRTNPGRVAFGLAARARNQRITRNVDIRADVHGIARCAGHKRAQGLDPKVGRERDLLVAEYRRQRRDVRERHRTVTKECAVDVLNKRHALARAVERGARRRIGLIVCVVHIGLRHSATGK